MFLVGACLGLTAFAVGPAVVRESKVSAQNYAYAYGAWAMSHLKDSIRDWTSYCRVLTFTTRREPRFTTGKRLTTISACCRICRRGFKDCGRQVYIQA